MALAGFMLAPPSFAQDASPAPRGRHADFAQENPGRDARHVANWVLDSGDNKGLPFAVIDKIAARVFVFDPQGSLRGAAAALLGIARGDHSVPGVGERELSAIRVQDRTTPAGRFESALGRNYEGKDILWVDYDTAISMHPVINTKPMERRPHRLASPTPLDNRISFGCINVPIPFFKNIISASFAPAGGIVYVLPEVVPLRDFFASYDVDQRARKAARAGAARGEMEWDL